MKIEFRNLEQRFSGRTVFASGVFTLAGPRLVLLEGPNGCGKSTLLRILASLVRPTEGDLLVGGISVRGGNDLRAHVSYCGPREGPFLPRLTGRENLELFARLAGLGPADCGRRLAELRGRGLLTEPALSTRVLFASTGMRQALHVARAFLLPREIVLLDEPGRALDSEAAERLHAFLREQGRERLVLVASHAQGEKALATARILFCGGRVQLA